MTLLSILVLSLLFLVPASAQLSPPHDAGVAMGHVHLNVRDVEQHKKIWIDHFGAMPLEREGLPGVKIPGMLLVFRQREPSGGTEGTVMDHFGLKVPNLANALAAWRAAGYEVQAEFTGTEGFPNAYLKAPDDVKIELQQDVDLPHTAIAYHLHFYGMDHMTLLDWYVETFAAFKRKRGHHDAADVPGMNLTFNTPKQPRPGTKGRALDHIGFEVKNLEAFCKKLEAKGVKFDIPYREVPRLGLGVAFLTDPSGVYIELTEGLDKY